MNREQDDDFDWDQYSPQQKVQLEEYLRDAAENPDSISLIEAVDYLDQLGLLSLKFSDVQSLLQKHLKVDVEEEQKEVEENSISDVRYRCCSHCMHEFEHESGRNCPECLSDSTPSLPAEWPLLREEEISEVKASLGEEVEGKYATEVFDSVKSRFSRHLCFIKTNRMWYSILDEDAKNCSAFFGWKMFKLGEDRRQTGIPIFKAKDIFEKLSEKRIPFLVIKHVKDQQTGKKHYYIAECSSDSPKPEGFKLANNLRWKNRIMVLHPNAWTRWSEDEEKKLMKMWSEGKTPAEISRALGRTVVSIRAKLKSLGLLED